MPDGGKQAVQLGVLEAVSGHRQQGDEAGVDQQALGNLPAGAHAHHMVQEHLRKGAAGKGSRLHAQRLTSRLCSTDASHQTSSSTSWGTASCGQQVRMTYGLW